MTLNSKSQSPKYKKNKFLAMCLKKTNSTSYKNWQRLWTEKEMQIGHEKMEDSQSNF